MRTIRSALLGVVCLATFAAPLGCTYAPEITSCKTRCSASGVCPNGFTCQGGVCVSSNDYSCGPGTGGGVGVAGSVGTGKGGTGGGIAGSSGGRGGLGGAVSGTAGTQG